MDKGMTGVGQYLDKSRKGAFFCLFYKKHLIKIEKWEKRVDFFKTYF